MENDIKAILQKLDGLDTRLTGLEQTVDHGFAHTAQQITNLAAKVTLLEQSMREQFAEVGEHIAGVMTMATERFDEVNTRLDRIEKSHDYRLETLERDVASLKT